MTEKLAYLSCCIDTYGTHAHVYSLISEFNNAIKNGDVEGARNFIKIVALTGSTVSELLGQKNPIENVIDAMGRAVQMLITLKSGSPSIKIQE